jgi:cholesterol oxidase
MTPAEHKFDYDWIVIGSGFGGSVAALRLAEKGYNVAVLERGRRFADDGFAKSAWDVRNWLWAPTLGLRGIFRLTPFKDVLVASGAGVGGGSLVYANTLYRAAPEFFENPQWAQLADWAQALAPHYEVAERMLGVTQVPFESDGQQLLQEMGAALGVSETFTRTPCAVFFGEPGKKVSDPYFGGDGPARTGCTRCGACMVGCRVGAKNTLVKNYLWFAEKLGVDILPERQVTDVRPLGGTDGGDGYRVITEYPGAWCNKRRHSLSARGVVFAAGALGTNQLLADCKHAGSLPNISDRLGALVRTNSESILAVTLPSDTSLEPWRDVAISGSIYPEPNTHIEFVTYGKKGDAVNLLFTILVGDGTRLTRPLRFLGGILQHPIRFLKTLWPVGWSRRSVIFLVMQSLDNAITLVARPRMFGAGVRLMTRQDPDKPNPTFIPAGNQSAQWLASKTGGIAQSMVLEALANIPSTAHILGGATIGASAASGVVNAENRVFGYKNLLVCDGSVVPANPGVNPSLTITAIAEHAMSRIPPMKKAPV